jgi:hypothetical protein
MVKINFKSGEEEKILFVQHMEKNGVNDFMEKVC